MNLIIVVVKKNKNPKTFLFYDIKEKKQILIFEEVKQAFFLAFFNKKWVKINW